MSISKMKKTKNYWVYFVLAVFLLIAAIFLAPVWSKCGDWCFWKNWGTDIINLIICVLLLLYLFGYLIKKIIHGGNGTIKVLTIVEFVLLLLIAIGCVLAQFKVINVSGACKIFGLALWCRGTIECIRGYLYRHDSSSKVKYPIWLFCLALFMVTFGTYAFAKPFFTDIQLLWVFIVLIFVLSIVCFIYGVVTNPQSSSTKKSTK